WRTRKTEANASVPQLVVIPGTTLALAKRHNRQRRSISQLTCDPCIEDFGDYLAYAFKHERLENERRPRMLWRYFTPGAARREREWDATSAKYVSDRVAVLRCKRYVEDGSVGSVALNQLKSIRDIVGRTNGFTAQIVQPITQQHGDQRFI